MSRIIVNNYENRNHTTFFRCMIILFGSVMGGEKMNAEIIIAMISLLGTLAGSLGGILVSSKMTNYRLQQLENRVAEHNNFARRMPVVEEQIKVINHRIEDIERSGLHEK